MKVLHLTDIHLKSKYADQFHEDEHLSRILNETRGIRDSLDAVIVTGDLIDEGTYEDYAKLLILLKNTYGEDMPILVTPGNHDNRDALEDAYSDFRRGKAWKNSEHLAVFGSFKKPGESVIILETYETTELGYKIPWHKIVLMDTAHREYPYGGLCRLSSIYQNAASPAHKKYILFTHMPIIRPFHMFMNQPQFTLPDDDNVFLATLASTGCDAIVCGHYHSESHKMAFGIRQYAGPASQVQIDPYTKTCNPSGIFPGYAILTDFGQIEYSTHYIVEEPTTEESK